MIRTSPDGQWALLRRGREAVLLAAGAAPPVGQLTLDSDDIELAFVGPPSLLVSVAQGPAPRVQLHQPPYLDAIARLDLDAPMRLAAVSGQRLVLLSADRKQVQIVRGAGRSLATQTVDPGGPVEFAVGLERNQVLLGLLRKLEVWDAVSGRPLLRLQLQLPPPPRTVGSAQGHLWVTRPGSDEVFIYRLSDGRPFRHYVGAPVEDVICHPSSPVIVLVTPRGLVRLHCFAHSLTVIDAPWTPGTHLAQLAAGEDVSLLGWTEDTAEPWRVSIGGAGAPLAAPADGDVPIPPLETAADKLRAMRERAGGASAPDASPEVASVASAPVVASAPSVPHAPVASPVLGGTLGGVRTRAWRDPLVAFGAELARGVDGEVPVVPVDTELGELAHRLGLPTAARRALTALYALHVIGEPAIAISRLGQALGDWTEGLGQGELGRHAMLRRADGRVRLRTTVTALLDGNAPVAARVVGGPTAAPPAGAWRLPRDGRTDAELEAALLTRLGRIAVIERRPRRALLEARLAGATAVALRAPAERPHPWPQGAALVVVSDSDDASRPAWVSALPPLA